MRQSPVQLRAVAGTRDLLDLHRHDPQRYPHLLESVAHGTPHARFDILFAFPEESLVLEADAGLRAGGAELPAGAFLTALDEKWRSARIAHEAAPLPFRGGWFLFLGYELASQIEPTLRLPRAEDPLPVAFAMRIPAAVIRDHDRGVTWLLAEQGRQSLLDTMEQDLQRTPSAEVSSGPRVEVAEDDPAGYITAVERIRRYIRAGDVFQVNLSRRWQVNAPGLAAADLYARLRRTNPAPFAALSRWGETSIISSSPERLVQVIDDRVQTRPIAGTRPRAGDDRQDRAFSDELLAHPKERAEHIMLIDLERNDLGRVCRAGSVEVNELMVLESYAHVHHIVSNVRGTLRPGVTPGQVIAAVFPGGTITGCPKVRCMEIIAELEGAGRGAYTGSLGYLNRDGDLDLNILIRTLVHRGDRVTVRAGAGIVADSAPQRELEETRAKARGMLLALRPEGGHD